MQRLIALLMLTIALAGCGDTVVDYQLSSETIERFAANAEELGARDDANSPLAISVLASNQVGAPEGVQVSTTGI